MKQLTCEMCGSTDLLKQGGVFVCQTCGCKYSVEEAKKMMIEGTVEVSGTVKVDKSKETEDLLDQAFALIKTGNFDAAIPMLNQTIAIDAKNARAYLGKILCDYKRKTTMDLSYLPSEKITGNVNYTLLLGCGDEAVLKELNDAIYANIDTLLEHSKGVLTHDIVQKIYSDGGDIVLPDSVRKIDERAFWFCESLESISIPASVKKIGESAFSGCKTLTEVKLSESLTEIEDGAFSGCKSLESISIPDSVKKIGAGAFSDCESLESISIPASVKKIGAEAFSDCKNLKEVNLPESLTEIEDSAFFVCESLESISIPASVKKIGESAFCECAKLTEIKLPESLTLIGEYTFEFCESLEKIVIPASVEKIENSAFDDCANLKCAIILNPNTNIGRFAFPDETQIVIGREADITESEPNSYDTKAEGGTGGGCYVATAVYGSYDCPQVWTLRRYRDYTLAETWYGRAFIRTYYAISPTLVKWFGNTNWFKKLWKGKLDRMVAKLQNSGVENTPYEDKSW